MLPELVGNFTGMIMLKRAMCTTEQDISALSSHHVVALKEVPSGIEHDVGIFKRCQTLR